MVRFRNIRNEMRLIVLFGSSLIIHPNFYVPRQIIREMVNRRNNDSHHHYLCSVLSEKRVWSCHCFELVMGHLYVCSSREDSTIQMFWCIKDSDEYVLWYVIYMSSLSLFLVFPITAHPP